jgi:hypothetical protein
MTKIKREFFSTDQELFISLVFALFCLFSVFIFPAQNSAQAITKSLFFLLLLPIAYIKIILREDLAYFGWNLKNQNLALRWGIGICLCILVLFYLLTMFTQFKTGYILNDSLKNNFWLFSAYELVLVNLSIFIFSFFFQGFILLLFDKKIAHWSIAIQAAIFFATLIITKNISWQNLPLIILSITGGFLTYKTKSFFYSYFMSFFVIIILDTFIIYLTK